MARKLQPKLNKGLLWSKETFLLKYFCPIYSPPRKSIGGAYTAYFEQPFSNYPNQLLNMPIYMYYCSVEIFFRF